MKYVNVGTPDYEIYVPDNRTPIVIGIRDYGINEQGDHVKLNSSLVYPDRSFASPLNPKEVVKRFEEANSEVPGLNYD